MCQNPKILVVNDVKETLDLLVRVVKRSTGVDPVSATSFEDAKTKVSENLDIAVLDYHLDAKAPQKTEGIDLAEQIKKAAPECYVILVSATSESPPDLHGRNFSIDAYVSLRYVDTNPASLLRDELRRALDHQK